MNLFKLSFRNIQKLVKDYLIYFVTLIVAVSIFYVFNAISDQSMVDELTVSGQKLIQINGMIMSYESVIAVAAMADLILYSNRFLIKRRKKEFGVYLMLGMGKRKVAGILFVETVLIGIASLIVGIILGIFESQFMALIVARIFELDMAAFRFTISFAAIFKTVLLFITVYCVVLIFNTIAISKCRLVNLLSAHKRNEKNLFRNPYVSFVVFVISVAILIYCYHYVSMDLYDISVYNLPGIVLLGGIATVLLFWSWSGWLLCLIRRTKTVYYKNVNSFVIRQFLNSVNSSSVLMAVICLTLFVTIVDINLGMNGRRNSMDDIKKMAPVDASIMCTGKSVEQLFIDKGTSIKEFFGEECEEVPIYYVDSITLGTTVGGSKSGRESFPLANWDLPIEIIGQDDYNKIATLYGQEPLLFDKTQYCILATQINLEGFISEAMKQGAMQQIGGQVLTPAYDAAVERNLVMSYQDYNMGIVVIPDEYLAGYEPIGSFLAGNYKVSDKQEKKEYENRIQSLFYSADDNMFNSEMIQEGDVSISIGLAIMIWENGVGFTAILTFATLYLGIVSLLACATLLAIKALSDSIDSLERYEILRKIGVDEKTLRRAKRKEVLLYFGLPLFVACIHSIFGLKFLDSIVGGMMIFDLGSVKDGIIPTVLMVGGLYGLYVLITYTSEIRIMGNVLRDKFGRHE